jgi:CubicO group peptidase (beta-lactamase class C family)
MKQEFDGSPLPANVLEAGLKIDHGALSVTVGPPLPGQATAVMRPGLGCVMAAGRPLRQLMKLRTDGPAGPAPDANALWPLGERVDTTRPIEGTDRARLEKAIDVAFGQCTKGGDPFTRAIVVVHGGRIVAERYGKDFRPGQRIYAASMSKSVASTLLGLRIADGGMTLDGVALPAAPARPDPITNRNLVTMTAGLKWAEEDARIEESDAVRMLLDEPDMAAFAAAKPAVSKPGSVFYYSSGSTNVLMASLRKSFHGDEQAYLNYPRKALFDPIGMRSAIFQTDADGNFVGSTFVWASARDWARLGLLYLHNGRWEGRQVLPRSWVDFVRTPAPATANLSGDERLSYGAGFWLTGASSPTTPAPVYAMVGIWGQTVLIEPARDLVVVRLGYTQKDCPTSDVKPIAELFPADAAPDREFKGR